MVNSGIDTVTTSLPRREVAHTRNSIALDRRLRFEARHPEIDIRARREFGGPLAFYVTEPDTTRVAWLDASAMMDDLEKRYPDD